MSPVCGRPGRAVRTALIFMISMALPGLARAGDITAFVTLPAPTENWSRGYGATLSSTWFQVVNLEAEAARLAPPIGVLTPYGGLGVGVFRQTLGSASDTGTLRAFILGAKVKLGLVVIKGEYRKINLSGGPFLEMTARISAGAGISF